MPGVDAKNCSYRKQMISLDCHDIRFSLLCRDFVTAKNEKIVWVSYPATSCFQVLVVLSVYTWRYLDQPKLVIYHLFPHSWIHCLINPLLEDFFFRHNIFNTNKELHTWTFMRSLREHWFKQHCITKGNTGILSGRVIDKNLYYIF